MPSSSNQKPMIYVQTLGGFSIKTGDLQINDNRNQSKKPWALLEYLIVFQKKGYYTRADLCTTTRSIKIRESDAQIRLHIFC